MEPLLQQAGSRWYKAHEVFHLLRCANDIVSVTNYSAKPKHGDLFIIKRSKFPRWKQDGHSYRLRRSGTGVREDREKYYDSSDAVVCTYVHSADSSSFHRRAYWLMCFPDTVLVHYLDDRLAECRGVKEKYDEPLESTPISSQTTEMFEDSDQAEELARVEIVDFSPDWDDVTGGAKVLICVSPAVAVPDTRLLFVAFDDIRVSLEHVQVGVMRCRAPPHMPGFVDLYLLYDDHELTVQRKQFQYKQMSRKRSEPSAVSWRSLNDHEFKVRLVEHMTSFDTTMDWQIGDPDDSSIDNLIAQFVMRIQQLGQDPKVLDEHGFSIIHYCAALDMTTTLKLFDDDDYYVKTEDGLTPLEIAMAREKFGAIAVLTELSSELDDATEINTKTEDRIRSALTCGTRQRTQSEKGVEKQVKLIQSNVKSWLMRRHLNDVSRATGIMKRGNCQTAVNTLLLRKQFLDQKKAAQLIQKTYRLWLRNKESLKSTVRQWPSFKRMS